MRVAPIGLPYDAETAFEIAVAAAAITHGHPSGYLSAGVLAAIISGLTHGMALTPAIDHATQLLRRWPGHDETLGKLWQAIDLAATALPAFKCVHAMGGGWTGEEAVAIAVFCALRHQDDYAAAVLAAVNHDGDSDSTGSICGAIIGTLLGVDAIAQRWVAAVEGAEDLKSLAFISFTA